MTKRISPLRRLFHRSSKLSQSRGRVLRRIASRFDLIYFGAVDPRRDEVEPVRGFTSFLSHIDSHFMVGSIDEYDIRIIDRFDAQNTSTSGQRGQTWCIIEISLTQKLPHIAMIPTGRASGEYKRLFNGQRLQPINTMLLQNHSLEVHGRFQILASIGQARQVEEVLTSPLTVGISARFWPHGIEIADDKLYVYITERRLSGAALEPVIASAVWLAQMLDEA